MKQEYYKSFRECLNSNGKWKQSVYFGFPKDKVPLADVREMMKKHYFWNRIIITQNLVVFGADLNSHEKTASKKAFQKARTLDNVIVFSPMSYEEYNVTKTARKVIIENNVKEKEFTWENYISVHENKLSIQKREKHFDISLELENINVKIEKMEEERNKEIDNRIIECLK